MEKLEKNVFMNNILHISEKVCVIGATKCDTMRYFILMFSLIDTEKYRNHKNTN